MAALAPAITPQTTVGVMLAAGRGERFGGDKLASPLAGASVLAWSASALLKAGCADNAAVAAAGGERHRLLLDMLGLTVLENPDPGSGLGASLRIGVAWARSVGAKALLLTLGDMPLIAGAHLAALFERINRGDGGLAFSISDGVRMPPAISAANWFDRLEAASGDRGARALLAEAPEAAGVAADASRLIDIDTRSDLAAAETQLAATLFNL